MRTQQILKVALFIIAVTIINVNSHASSVFLFSRFGASSAQLNVIESANWNEYKRYQFDQFAVTGYTRNNYGANYSISLRVTGSSSYYGNSINKVEYNNGSSWVSTSYYRVIGEDDTYRVSVGGNSYYFTF
jgi:hypothetical protein